jgi:acetoin utilization deacetylase AcuC-like enzyme
MIIIHGPDCVDYSAPGHPERPARITGTVPLLQKRHRSWEWREPGPATDQELVRAHTRKHVAHVAQPVADFDVDTPAYPQIESYARKSAGAAVAAAEAARQGDRVFVLNRPPGHHATRDRAMGFCYFNNVAVAALDAICQSGSCRVAIWDFDAHHGNGTEDIVARNRQIRFASIHQFPAYPGTGAHSFENIYNYPVAPQTPRAEHMDACRRALDQLLEFEPDLLLVSAGFDAYARDPLVQMTLQTEDFATFGKWLSETGVPTAAILEGGYSDDLPELIDAFLTAWNGC